MADETEDGITYPTNTDEYALTADLAAMAASIQQALEVRANARFGTQSERVAETSNVPEGTLWWDTTGKQGLYAREGTGWTLIFPQPENRRVLAGSLSKEIGQPFLVLGQVLNGTSYASTLIQTIYQDHPNFQMRHIVNNSTMSRWVFNYNGLLSYTDHENNAPMRVHPFAYRSGTILVSDFTPNERFTRTVTFPAGYFDQTPRISLTMRTAQPENTFISVGNAPTENEFPIVIYRQSTLPFIIEWEATQWYPANT